MSTFTARMTPKKALHLGKISNGIQPGLKKAMGRVTRIVLKQVRHNASGAVIQRRSGRLFRGIKGEVLRIPQGWASTVGASLGEVPYFRIQDKGGMTGRNHATKIPKSNFLTKAAVQVKHQVRRELTDFITKLVRG